MTYSKNKQNSKPLCIHEIIWLIIVEKEDENEK